MPRAPSATPRARSACSATTSVATPSPLFFVTASRGPQAQPKKSARRRRDRRAAQAEPLGLRDQRERSRRTRSASARRPCARCSGRGLRRPCRGASTRSGPARLRARRVEPVADVREFSLAPRALHHRVRRAVSLLPDLVRLEVEALADGGPRCPARKMIPAAHALRACLALKLWSIERKSHVMALVADEGLALVRRAQRHPEEELPLRVLLARSTTPARRRCSPPGIGRRARGRHALRRRVLQSRLPLRALLRRGPAGRAPLRLDAQPRASRACSPSSPRTPRAARSATPTPICARARRPRRSSASSTSGRRHHGEHPRHLVFDSRLTTYANLARLDEMGITFITLRRRSPSCSPRSPRSPPSAWRPVELDVPARKFTHPARLRADGQARGLRRSASSSSTTSATRSRRSC